MTTTPSKSSKHRFESENEFDDDQTFEEFEEFEDESEFNDDHAFEKFEEEGEFNDDQVNPESWRLVKEFKDDHAFKELKDESEFNDDHAFEESKVKHEFDRVRKFVRLIFIYYKSEVSGRSGPKVHTRQTSRIACKDFPALQSQVFNPFTPVVAIWQCKVPFLKWI